jgi:hypothetical protein
MVCSANATHDGRRRRNLKRYNRKGNCRKQKKTRTDMVQRRCPQAGGYMSKQISFSRTRARANTTPCLRRSFSCSFLPPALAEISNDIPEKGKRKKKEKKLVFVVL